MEQDKWIGECLFAEIKQLNIREAAELKNVPLYCPKGRQETPSILLQLNISMRKEAKDKKPITR